MEITNRKERIIVGGVVLLLIASAITSGIFFSSNRSLEKVVKETKLKSETLLSEKLSMEKQVAKIKKEWNALWVKNEESNKLLAAADSKILQQEMDMTRVVKENKQKKFQLENHLSDIQKSKSELEKQMADLNVNYNYLKSENRDMSEAIAALEKENQDLLNNLMLIASLDADNFRIESLKGKKDRLTVNARSVKKLKVGFDVPLMSSATLQFKIKTPDGKTFTSQDGSISYLILNEEKDWLASTSDKLSEIEVSKRIEMTYNPKQKLQRGIYTIEIYNVDEKLKSFQIRLK